MTESELAQRLKSGDRRALARAITLVESTRAEHRQSAEALMAELMPFAGGAHRVALTGVPGAGKSTLVDALGAAALAGGARVAVLAVDPASSISSGSLLGDAVRMQRLAASERVFLRPSSNAGALGGTAPGTREAVLLCEAAGFDLVLIETVGVGQAEHAVRDACDTLLTLTLAGAGDEVQGIKRGLLEVTDAVLVNKTDGPGEEAALAFAAELSAALDLLHRGNPPHVAAVSARTERGVAELVEWLASRFTELRASGMLEARRQEQQLRAFAASLSRELLQALRGDARVRALEAEVASGARLPTAAAREAVRSLLTSRDSS
ncbi:MAG: methylmalonyl Co-A mutase-associated GTPase MeaB [Myxococcales bacterium]|nr:MAG: methylmalonyl Co-A mutase-associated GTPase MeaB [Myxococcales bacterium]